MLQRTVRDFQVTRTIWPIVEAWANANGYQLKQENTMTRLYQQGHGALVAPIQLEITQRNSNVHLEAWITCDGFTRILMMLWTLFIIRPPAEMGLESGGLVGVIRRKKARNAINALLDQLSSSSAIAPID